MSYKGKFVSVIIPAAGLGKRMQYKENKMYILVKEKPILSYTIEKFNTCEYVDEIIIVTRKDELDYCKNKIVNENNFYKVKKVVEGGKERQDSVYNGIASIDKKCDIVLVHDGARPFVKEQTIFNSIEGAIENEACVVGVPVKDTIKIVDKSDIVAGTPERSSLWAVQTPQAFSYELIVRAYENARKERIIATDDSMLVEQLGYKVKMILGSYENIKITTPEDLKMAEIFLVAK